MSMCGTEQVSPISFLACLWPYECSTEPQLVQNSCAPYLSATLTEVAGKEVNSTRFVPFALYSVRPVISAPQADHFWAHPERDVVVRSKEQDGIL